MKRSFIVALMLVGALALSACGGAASPTTAPTAAASNPTAASGVATAASTQAAAPTTGANASATEISIEPANPTAAPAQPTPGVKPPDGGGIKGPGGTDVAVNQPPINPPTTLDDLKKQYPDLAGYIDSVKDKQIDGMDLAELYKRIIDIYSKNGASGVATFLKDSGILDKMNIPVSYLDLLIAYGDKGDIAAVTKLAKDRKLINDKDEVIGYLALDSKDSEASARNDLTALGVSVYSYNGNTEELEIGIPLKVLSQLQTPGKLIDYLVKIAHVNHVVGFRPPVSQTSKSFSLTTAQQAATVGAKTVGADKWQAAGITGKGVKIGVLDMGFGGILKVAGKQLPAADQIKTFQSMDELNAQDVDHGTAVAMVVHGMAPDAELYVAAFDGSSRQGLIDAIDFLLKSKVQVINYSVGSAVGPRDGTFGSAPMVDAIVKQTGVLWVNAAGNEAVDHTMFKYQDNGKGLHAFNEKTVALPFAPFEPITTVVMNWNGTWAGKEKSEYDFKILDEDGNEVATAAEAKKGRKNDFPFQAVSFEVTPKKVYYMVIHRESGSTDNVMDIFIPNALLPEWAQVPVLSVTTPGDANGAFTVGATGLTADDLEIYSSQGPTLDDRIKPDITAPTGEVLPGHEEGFSGTSGAAPLIAGAAGLVLQKYPDMKAEEVRAYLMKNVIDLGKKGEDPQFGTGRLALPAPDNTKSDDPGFGDNNDGLDLSGSTGGAQAAITKTETKYNVKDDNGVKGLAVNVSFEVKGMKGKKGAIAVLFFDANNKGIPGTDPDYTIGKVLGTGLTFTPKYDDTQFDDVVMFIPNTAFKGIPSGASQIQYIVAVLDLDNPDTPVAKSDPVVIKIKR